MKKPIFILFLIIILEAVILATGKDNPSSKIDLGVKHKYKINLTKDGFIPQNLTVQKGDEVEFTTNRTNVFWPASNLHPTHLIYPEFDAKKPIESNESWSFTFNKVGNWRFHDHLAPLYTGVINVSGGNGQVEQNNLTACIKIDSLDIPRKQQCWDNQLQKTLQTQGLDAAFDLFAELYATEPDVPKACHGWGHVLGEAAYELYVQKKEFPLKKETAYCGYGFFHGFIEKLLQSSGQLSETKVFCDSIKQKAGSELTAAYRNCIHGVGHGTSAWILEDQKFWGNFQAAADKGLSLCESVLKDSEDLRNCYDGVFNQLVGEVRNENFKFSFREFVSRQDPFIYCYQQKERHKESCYFEFVSLFTHNWLNTDPFEAFPFIVEHIPNSNHIPIVLSKLAADYMENDITKNDYSKNVQSCRNIPDHLFNPCFHGIINGFFQHGEPQKEYMKAVEFCKAPYLTSQEKNKCNKVILGFSRSFYSQNKLSEICRLMDNEFRKANCSI